MLLGSTIGSGFGALAGGVGASTLGIGGAFAAGAIGSLAGQLVGNILGVQDGFSFKQMALAGLSAGVGAKLAQTGFISEVVSDLGINDGLFATMAKAGISNVLSSQAVNIVAGQQNGFNWRSVAASAISAGVSAKLFSGRGAIMNGQKPDPVTSWDKAVDHFVEEVGVGAVRQGIGVLFKERGSISWSGIASNALNSTISEAYQGMYPSESNQSKRLNQSTADVRDNPSVQRGLSQHQVSDLRAQGFYAEADELQAQLDNPVIGQRPLADYSSPYGAISEENWALEMAGAAEAAHSRLDSELYRQIENEYSDLIKPKTGSDILREYALPDRYQEGDPMMVPTEKGWAGTTGDFIADNFLGREWGGNILGLVGSKFGFFEPEEGFIINPLTRDILGPNEIRQAKLDLLTLPVVFAERTVANLGKTGAPLLEGVVPDTVADEFVGPLIGKSGFKSTTELSDQVYLKYQSFIDDAYTDVQLAEAAGELRFPAKIPKNTYKGQLIDKSARDEMRFWLESEGLTEGAGEIVNLNRRLYNPGGSGYRIPDVRVPGANVIYDATLAPKNYLTPQVIDFGRYSNGGQITIVRPTEIGGSYSILQGTK